MRSFRRSMSHSGSCVIEISAGSVTASLLYAGHVTFSYQHTLPEIGEMGSAKHIAALRRAHQYVLARIEKEGCQALRRVSGTKKITHVLMVYHAPWSSVYTRHFHLERKESFVLRREKLEAFLKKAQEERPGATPDIPLSDTSKMEVVEQVPASLLINGYQAAYQESRNVRTLSADYFFGTVSSALLDFRDDVEKQFGYHTTIFQHTHAYLLSSFVVARFPKKSHALLVSVSDEMTEIGVLKDGVLLQTTAAHVGTNTLARTLAKIAKTVPQETKTYLKKDSAAPFSVHIKHNISSVGEVYREGVTEALALLRESHVIPKHIFLIAPYETDGYFAHVLKKTHPSTLTAITDASDDVREDGGKDPFLGVYAWLMEKYLTMPEQDVL